MGFAKNITKQVRKDTGKHLIYPPGVPLQLGDVVMKDDGIWIPIANLYDDIGFEPDISADTQPDDNWSPTSQHGFGMKIKLAGEPGSGFKHLIDAEAGVRIDLSGESAFALAMSGVRFDRIASVPVFWDTVKAARSYWNWDFSHRIVTQVVRADSATFLASAGRDSSFELVAEAGVDVSGVQLGDLSANFSFKSNMSAKDRFVSKQGATPLFAAFKRKRLGGGVGPASVDELGATLPEIEIEEDDGSDDT